MAYSRVGIEFIFGGLATEQSVASFAINVLPMIIFFSALMSVLYHIGVMQFIAPTLQFIVGLSFGEVLTVPHVVCFTLIWTAATLFSWDAWRQSRAPETGPPAARTH